MAAPPRALLQRAARLVGGELPRRLLEVGERLELGVERGRGGGEAVELADERGGLGVRGGAAAAPPLPLLVVTGFTFLDDDDDDDDVAMDSTLCTSGSATMASKSNKRFTQKG